MPHQQTLALTLLLSALSLSSCTPREKFPPNITRTQILQHAQTYATHPWTPSKKNQLHGPDPQGILVHTPDFTLPKSINQHGWWKPNTTNYAIPYCWGGFDTTANFNKKIQQGYAAGDIATPTKIHLNNQAVSQHTTGLDCSGFISRCLTLPTHHDTRQLPQLCTPLPHWNHLKPGDLLLKKGHVILFAAFAPNNQISCYEAGCAPLWRVHRKNFSRTHLQSQGFQPYRYSHIQEK